VLNEVKAGFSQSGTEKFCAFNAIEKLLKSKINAIKAVCLLLIFIGIVRMLVFNPV
jgi:hypothetical protein